MVCEGSNQDFFSSQSPTSLQTQKDFKLLFHSIGLSKTPSVFAGQTPTCAECVSRDVRQLSTKKLLQNHMEVYTDSHHSEITQVMYNKLYSDNQSWNYIFCTKGFLDELVFSGWDLGVDCHMDLNIWGPHKEEFSIEHHNKGCIWKKNITFFSVNVKQSSRSSIKEGWRCKCTNRELLQFN